jgi:hypothetical protein
VLTLTLPQPEIVTPPSRKSMVPPSGVGLTVAVYVTICPTADGFVPEASMVVVGRAIGADPLLSDDVETVIDPRTSGLVTPEIATLTTSPEVIRPVGVTPAGTPIVTVAPPLLKLRGGAELHPGHKPEAGAPFVRSCTV